MSEYVIFHQTTMLTLLIISFLFGGISFLAFEYIYTDYYRQCKNEYQKELARIELRKLFEKEVE